MVAFPGMSAEAREICSWSDFVAYVEGHHAQAVVSAKQRIRFEVRHANRSELVLGWCQPAPTRTPWLGLAMSLGHHALFRKRAALVANRRLPIGGFALLRETMFLTQTLPLQQLRVAHVEETLTGLAETVALLSASAAPDAPEDAPFAYVFTTRMDVIP